jgi:hypothetical protein
MQKLIVVAVCLICLLKINNIHAQTDSLYVKPTRNPVLCEIKMHDGSSYMGYIQQQTDSIIYLKSSLGVILHIPKHSVQNIYYVNRHSLQDTTGGIPVYHPFIADRYYVSTSNAFLFKRNEIYGSSDYLLFYNLNYALNQNFSIGVSSSVIGVPVAFHAKANFEVAHRLYLGVDGFMGSGSWIDPKTYGGGGVVKLTYGEAKTNYTFFAGYGDVEYFVKPRRRRGRGGMGGGPGRPGYYNEYNSIIAGGALSTTLSTRMRFVLEAYAFPQVNVYTLSPCIRLVTKPNVSWVFGLEGIFNTKVGATEFVSAYPYIGFSFRL